MKIVVVGPSHPYRGGIAAFTDRLANEFVAEGDDVHLYTFTLQYPSIFGYLLLNLYVLLLLV